MSLKSQLEEFGCPMSVEEFRDRVSETFIQLFPAWTVEQLVIYPHTSIGFCARVNDRLNAQLPDELILGTLMNLRKQGSRGAKDS